MWAHLYPGATPLPVTVSVHTPLAGHRESRKALRLNGPFLPSLNSLLLSLLPTTTISKTRPTHPSCLSSGVPAADFSPHVWTLWLRHGVWTMGKSAWRPANICIYCVLLQDHGIGKVAHQCCSAIQVPEWRWWGRADQFYSGQEERYRINLAIPNPPQGVHQWQESVVLTSISILRSLSLSLMGFNLEVLFFFFSFKNYLLKSRKLLLEIGWLANLGTVYSCSLFLLITILLVSASVMSNKANTSYS